MKEEILKLRAEGLSYRAIVAKLNCSKNMVAYYCSPGAKEKIYERAKRRRNSQPIQNKLESKTFCFNKKLRTFRDGEKVISNSLTSQEAINVLEKQNKKCYLTGDELDLSGKDTVHFDHILPISKGGSSTKENLGICTRQANLSKSDMTLEEYLKLCQKVLINFGYSVTKI